MSGQSAIEWCDATFNPWWGCERVSPGCAHCYADTWARRLGMSDLWVKRGEHAFRFFSDKHWNEPLKWARTLPEKLGRRPRVFCASMADVFEDNGQDSELMRLLDDERERLWLLIEATPELDWLILTKRPEIARDWLGNMDPPYPNAWLGVSIENARYTWRADVLREIPSAVRFISAEPLLGSLYAKTPLDLSGIDWVIVGGESGPGARGMDLEWVREIIDHAGTLDPYGNGDRPAVFVKQLGSSPYEHLRPDLPHLKFASEIRDRKGGDMDEWPPDLRIREFPRTPEGRASEAVSTTERAEESSIG